MLTLVNMMGAAKMESGLTERLVRLRGEGKACCVSDYGKIAREVRGSPRFSDLLRRSKATADEHRLLCLGLLKRRGELCACELQAATGLTHPTVSHHMGVLVDAGLVRARHEGKWTYYALEAKAAPEVP